MIDVLFLYMDMFLKITPGSIERESLTETRAGAGGLWCGDSSVLIYQQLTDALCLHLLGPGCGENAPDTGDDSVFL